MKKKQISIYLALSFWSIAWSIPFIIWTTNSSFFAESIFITLAIVGPISSFASYIYFIFSVEKLRDKTMQKLWWLQYEWLPLFILTWLPFVIAIILIINIYYYTRPHNQNVDLP